MQLLIVSRGGLQRDNELHSTPLAQCLRRSRLCPFLYNTFHQVILITILDCNKQPACFGDYKLHQVATLLGTHTLYYMHSLAK